MLGQNELMNSRLSGSEQALATLSCERIQTRPEPRILIGGLGMGFTLRAVLAVLNTKARVVVAELVPAVVAWARGPMAELHGTSLTDPRVSIEETDVGRLIRSARASYDAILLDVDNGPEGLTRDANDSLYNMAGLTAARNALRPGGVLAVWSSGPDHRFTQRCKGPASTSRRSRCAPMAREAEPGTSSGSRRVWRAERVRRPDMPLFNVTASFVARDPAERIRFAGSQFDSLKGPCLHGRPPACWRVIWKWGFRAPAGAPRLGQRHEQHRYARKSE